MELRTVASLLANPTWLKRDNVHFIYLLGGLIPIDMVPGEKVFVVTPKFSSSDSSCWIYLRVQWDPLANPFIRASPDDYYSDHTEELFYNALVGKESEATTNRITAVVISRTPLNGEDQTLFSRAK